MLGIPEWAVAELAQGEVPVPFTDPAAREQDVDVRGTTFNIHRQFGRSRPRDKARSPQPLLAVFAER